MQCKAISKRSGERCRRPAIKGGFVCMTHGGQFPTVRAKANERLDQARLAMLDMLFEALPKYRQLLLAADSEAVMASVLKDLFDRVGLGATQKTQSHVTVEKSGEEIDEDIAALVEKLRGEQTA